MAPRKRARTSSTGGSSSSGTSVATIKLSGGESCPSGLVELWRSGLLTDTVVTVEGRSFMADRKVLAGSSEYFRRHFLNEQMERGAANPTLQEHVSAAAFEPLLSFLYEGECSFDETRLTEVLQAANYLSVKALEQAAVAALTDRLSPSNALAAWSLADQLSLPDLLEAARVTALKDFDELTRFHEATLEQMQSLVADDRLTAKSEEAVFSAVAQFAEAKQPAEAELFGLLRNVRFAHMSRAFLLETVQRWSVLDTKAGQRLLFEMVASAGPSQRPRSGFCANFMYVLGGKSGHRHDAVLGTVEVYNSQANTWAAGKPTPLPRFGAAAAVLDGKIYLIGGGETTHDDDSRADVEVFDPQTDAWADAPPMIDARSWLAAAVVGGKLYAIGGADDERGVSIRRRCDAAAAATSACAAGVSDVSIGGDNTSLAVSSAPSPSPPPSAAAAAAAAARATTTRRARRR